MLIKDYDKQFIQDFTQLILNYKKINNITKFSLAFVFHEWSTTVH